MRKPTLLILATSTLVLSACGGNQPTPSESKEQNSSSEKISESNAEPTTLSQEMLSAFQKGSLNFSASRKTSYTAYVDLAEEGTEDIYIGKSSYSFKEYSETTEETLKDVAYYKDEEGKVVSYEVDFRNSVNEVIVEGGRLVFDEVFYNPFKSLALSDFILGENGSYSLSEDKEASFWKPISFYEEIIKSVYFIPYSDGTMGFRVESEDSSSAYKAKIDGLISVASKDDLDLVSPYKSEDYHSVLQSAYDELVNANSFTYERNRKPVDEDVDAEEETYESKISKNSPMAVVFAYEGKDASGVARYDDGEDYAFAVKEGKAIKGEGNSIKLPFTVSTVKMEVFEKVDDTHFKARTSSIAKTIAGFLMEKLGDALLVDGSAFGDAGCENLTFEMADGHLAGFEYTVTRPFEDSGSYLEKNVVKIKDVNTTSIPYEFTTGTKKEDPAFDISSFVGEFEGYNVVGYADSELHSLKISDLENMTLDGEKLTFFSSVVQGESFNATWGDSRYVQISRSNYFGYSVREADDGTFKTFRKGVTSFYLNLAKKESSLPSLSDIALSNGWRFEDEEETEYKIILSTTLADSKFYVEERVDGSWQDVEKNVSEIAFDEDSATLTFKANDDSFIMKFYSKEQGIVKNENGTIKGYMSPSKDY